MPRLPAEENARRDAEAEAEFEAGIGVPADEVFKWLHDKIDGIDAPAPKARKLF